MCGVLRRHASLIATDKLRVPHGAAPSAATPNTEDLRSKCLNGDSTACDGYFSTSKASNFDFWKTHLPTTDLILQQKVSFDAPKELIEYLTVSNHVYGLKDTPLKMDFSSLDQHTLIEAIKSLPIYLGSAVNAHIVAIFIVKSFGSSGMSIELLRSGIKDAHKATYYTGKFIVVFDSHFLKMSANEWATTREHTAFKKPGAHNIRVVADNRDSPATDASFIFLHEAAHVLARAFALTYPNDLRIPDSVAEGFPFPKLSWIPRDGHFVSRFEKTFPEGGELSFYRDENFRMDAAKIKGVYAKLAGTSFPSLYGAQSPEEDFAESFATYVRETFSGKPYRVELTEENKRTVLFDGSWKSERLKEQKIFLEHFIEALKSNPRATISELPQLMSIPMSPTDLLMNKNDGNKSSLDKAIDSVFKGSK